MFQNYVLKAGLELVKDEEKSMQIYVQKMIHYNSRIKCAMLEIAKQKVLV